MGFAWPFKKPPPPVIPDDPSLFPTLIAILICWAAPSLLYLANKDKASTAFAITELVGCAIGNGLIAATPIYFGDSDSSEFAVLAVIFLLFLFLYFPAGQCLRTQDLVGALHRPLHRPCCSIPTTARVIAVSRGLSGGHFNAALTSGAWACGQVSLAMATLIFASQVLGSALGVEVTRYATDKSAHKFFGPVAPAHGDTGIATALAYEAACSVAMTLVQLGLCESVDHLNLLSTTLVVTLIKATGAFMDPLGPTSAALFARDGGHGLWEVGWLGGLVGGAVAGWIWRNVLNKKQ